MTRATNRNDRASHILWALPSLTLLLGAIGCDPGGATAPVGGIVPPKGPANLSLIDSLEDGDGWIDKTANRAGPWYTYNDATASATQYPASGDPYNADFASDTHVTDYGVSVGFARTTGTGFSGWGAGVGFDLSHPQNASKAPYNASGYNGLRFWIRARIDDPSVAQADRQYISLMTVKVLDSQSVGGGEGGVCLPSGTKKCGDAFSFPIQLQAAGSTTPAGPCANAPCDFSKWQKIDVTWDKFKQAGWGVPAATGSLDTTALLAIHFQFDSPGGRDFDVSIDDISFTLPAPAQ